RQCLRTKRWCRPAFLPATGHRVLSTCSSTGPVEHSPTLQVTSLPRQGERRACTMAASCIITVACQGLLFLVSGANRVFRTGTNGLRSELADAGHPGPRPSLFLAVYDDSGLEHTKRGLAVPGSVDYLRVRFHFDS